MHYSTLVTALAALGTVAAFPQGRTPGKAVPYKPSSIKSRSPIPSGHTVLRPVRMARRGLDRRQDTNFADLDLETQVEMIFGSASDDGSLTLANMTLFATDGRPLIMMESFETLTSSIDCDGSDGIMSLTFTDQPSMDAALSKWGWVNEAEVNEFVMIANHDGCSPEEERIPYIVSAIDNEGLTTTLTATETDWASVAGNFEMEFGETQVPEEVAARMLKRSTKSKRAVDTGTGTGGENGAVTLDLSTGSAGQGLTLFTDPTGVLTVTCADCTLSGTIALTGKAEVIDFTTIELTFTATPTALKAKALLGVTLAASLGQVGNTPLAFSQNVASIPLGGIVVPGVLSVGPKIDLEVGGSMTLSADATFNFGVEATIPDGAFITGNVLTPSSSSGQGFEGVNVALLPFTVDAITASVSANAFVQPTLSLGFDVLNGLFGAEASVKFQTPNIAAELTASFDPNGVCADDTAKTTTGIKLSSSATFDGQLFAGTDKTTAESGVSTPIFSASIPIAEVCFPIAIPGLTA